MFTREIKVSFVSYSFHTRISKSFDFSHLCLICNTSLSEQSEANGCTNQTDTEEVYVTLIRQLLKPEEKDIGIPNSQMLLESSSQRTAQPDLETALELLEEHAAKIEPVKALEALPDSVPIGRIQHFLEASLQNNINEKRRMQVLKGLLYAEHLQVHEQRMHYESQNVLMTEFNVCPVCKKRFVSQR